MRMAFVSLYVWAGGFWPAAGQAVNPGGKLTAACVGFHAGVVRQLETGKLAEATAALSKALAEPESVLGETCVWLTLSNLASASAYSGSRAEAEIFAERALKNLDRWYSPQDPIRLRSLQLLFSVQFEQGKRGKAREALRLMRALRIEQAQDRAIVHGVEAVQLQAERNYPDAERGYQRAIAAWKEAGRGETMEAAAVLNGLCSLYLEQERYVEAGATLDLALAIANSAKDAVATDRIKILQTRAVLHSRQRRWQEAAEDLRDAISIADQSARLDASVLKAMLANYAWVLRKARRKSEARSVEARAAAIGVSGLSNAIVDVTELRVKE